MTSSRQAILAVVSAAAGLLVTGPSSAAEPRAAFALKSGWVSVQITRDGVGVEAAALEIFDAGGRSFATGETGAKGQATFPLPPGPSCIVQIKLGDRHADPIRLRRADDGLFPGEVLLSFGLAPCCRIPSRGWGYRPETTTPPPAADGASPWLVAAAAAGGSSLALFVGLLFWPSRPGPKQPTEEGTP